MTYQPYTTAFDVTLTAAELAARPRPEGIPAWEPDARRGGALGPEETAEAVADAVEARDLEGAAMTVLVDQSGSQRGVNPLVVATVDLTVRMLEAAGAKVEVLAFTTLSWKGGEARRAWVEAGRPRNPGRLSDVLHIVYKDFDHAWDEGGGEETPRGLLGRLYRDPYMRENLDGEAIRWATSRLVGRPEPVKMIVGVGDFQPACDSTMSLMGLSYLAADMANAVDRAHDAGISTIAIANQFGRNVEDGAERFGVVAYAGVGHLDFAPVAAAKGALQAAIKQVALRDAALSAIGYSP